jgi:hypothetical protein
VYPHNEFSGSDGDTNAATVSVSVSVNGGYDYASISTPISVLPNRRILNLVPESGPSKGMTALTVSGIALHTAFDTPKRLAHLVLDGTNGGLPPIRSALEGGLYCLFGGEGGTDGDISESGVVEVEATILDSTTLSCMTPEWVNTASPVSTSPISMIKTLVRVAYRPAGSLSKAIYQADDAYFSYYPSLTLDSISPTNGPARGGTIISIFGSGFINSTSLSVQFTIPVANSDSSDYIVHIPGIFLSFRD